MASKYHGLAYYLERAYVLLLKQLLPPFVSTVDSTIDFIEKSKKIEISYDCILESLEIESLYPSFDTFEVAQSIELFIDNRKDFDESMKNTLNSVINLIMNSNFLIFDNAIYEQSCGAPIGSPISGLLAELKLRTLE